MQYKFETDAHLEHEFRYAGRRFLYLLDSAWTTKKEADQAQSVRRRAGDLARIMPIRDVRGNLVLLCYAVYFNPSRVLEIISTHLSDGTFVRMTFYDGYYTIMHSALEPLVAPEIHDKLTRSEAYNLFENILRNDVLEKEV